MSLQQSVLYHEASVQLPLVLHLWHDLKHLLVDTLGLVICAKVLAADITDREGAKVLLTALIGKLPRLLLIWADSG